MATSHTIRRQVFELNCRDMGQGKVLLGNVEAEFAERVLPAMEAVFDSFSDADEVVVIERLEIDLGDVGEAEFARDLPRLVAEELRRQLQQLWAGTGSGDIARPADSAVEFRRIPASGGAWEALRAFLESGLLPWWAAAGEFRPWKAFLEEAVRNPERMRAYLMQAGGLPEMVGPSLGGAAVLPGVWVRVAGAGEPEVFEAAMEVLLGRQMARQVLALLAAMVDGQVIEVDWTRDEVWRLRAALLVAAAVGRVDEEFVQRWEMASGSPGWRKFAQAMMEIDSWQPKQAFSQQKLSKHLGIQVDGQLAAALAHWVRGKYSEIVGRQNPKDKPGPDSEANSQASKVAFEAPAPHSKKKGNPAQSAEAAPMKRPVSPKPIPQEDLFIPNAGLALVAPFLPSYFEHLGMLTGGQFRDEDARQRAVRLMEVIARGLHPCEEQDLVFNKVLAGMRMDAPLNMTLETGPEDLETADELLRSVIANWTVLGDIQPDQLRGGFLLREGALVAAGNNRKLRVDRKSYDVVLESLPWSMSIISLPWMAGLVFVEW